MSRLASSLEAGISSTNDPQVIRSLHTTLIGREGCDWCRHLDDQSSAGNGLVLCEDAEDQKARERIYRKTGRARYGSVCMLIGLT